MGLLTFRWPEEAHGTREVERERPRRCARQSRLQARIGVFALGVIVVVVAARSAGQRERGRGHAI